jgi:flagellar hook protein FlgE
MSLYTSLTGLKASQTELDVISHNIANSETVGFKRSTTNFADLVPSSSLTDPNMTVGLGTRVDSISQNFTQGPIEQTGNALDLAISGEGFFETKNGSTGDVQFTRAGSFKVDDQGFIYRSTNERLQLFAVDATGAVDTTGATVDAQIPATNAAGSAFSGVTVDPNGNVVATYADGSNANLGRVALASFTSPAGLKQLGSSAWSPTGQSGVATFGVPGEGKFAGLMAGSLERSNVDITEELVGLITAQRNFQANAKAIDTSSQVTQSIINLRT